MFKVYFKNLDNMLFGHDWNVLVGMFCFEYVFGRSVLARSITINVFINDISVSVEAIISLLWIFFFKELNAY